MKRFICIAYLISINLIYGQDLERNINLVEGKLANGMKYYLLKNEKPKQKATMRLVVEAGSLQETDSQQGIAHFLEHMAFNGTKKYEKNEIVKYMESIGMNFGGDINAHTSFGETIYKLEVPTKDKEKYREAINILNEWAFNITFDEKDINEEKSIIEEEWRTSRGLSHRMFEFKKKYLFGDSIYAKRLPIGKVDIFNKFKKEDFLSYYNTWYRAENMSIVIVGDFNKEETEKYLNEIFVQNKEAVAKEVKEPVKKGFFAKIKDFIKGLFGKKEEVKEETEKEYVVENLAKGIDIFRDKELTANEFEMISHGKAVPGDSEESFKEYLTDVLVTTIINNRYKEIISSQIVNYKSAGLLFGDLTESQMYYIFRGELKENNVEKGIEEVLTVLEKIYKNGFNDREIKLEIRRLKMIYSDYAKNKSSITNANYAKQITREILNGDTFTDVDYEYELFNKIIKEISKEDLNEKMREILEKRYDTFLLYLMENEKNGKITKEQVEKIIENVTGKEYKISEATEGKEFNLDVDLEEKEITSKKKLDNDITEIVLENGIKAYYKKTDFDKDSIIIEGISRGGTSLVADSDYYSARYANSLVNSSGLKGMTPVEKQRFFKDKTISFNSSMGGQGEEIRMSTNKEWSELAFQLLYTSITEPEIDEVIFKRTIENAKEHIRSRKNSPKAHLYDKINELTYDNHPRKKPTTLKDLESVTMENSLKQFKERFASGDEFKFFIVGSIDEDKLESQLRKYLGNLPKVTKKEEGKDIGLRLAKGIKKAKVVKGRDEKAVVSLAFPFIDEYNQDNSILYKRFSDVLNILLIEDVREKLGGVYSIRSSASYYPFSRGQNQLRISFTTKPEKTDEVIKEVFKVIKKVQDGKFTKKEINSIVRSYRSQFEDAIKENPYWSGYMKSSIMYGIDREKTLPKNIKKVTTKKNIQDMANKSVDFNNYIEVILEPEKKKK